MVSSKPRANPNPPLPKNPKDFKIYNANERPRPVPAADLSSKPARMPPPAVSRRSFPAAAVPGRKALADVSNARISQLRDSKPIKDKPEGKTVLQGKSSCVRSPRALMMNKENRRVSLAKSVVVASASLRRSLGGKVKGKENSMGKSDSSVRTGRKPLSVIGNANNEMSGQFRNRLSNNAKIMKDKLEGSGLPQGNSNRIKNPQGLRISLPRSLTVSKISSTKPPGIIPKNRTSMIKRTSIKDKPTAVTSFENKEVEISDRSNCEDNALIPHQECGSNISSIENVTAIISRPKCRRRRSYTSSLMAGTKIMGECDDLVKNDELSYIDDHTNPLEVSEYVDDIYQYYWTMEVLSPSLANYMVIQSEITPRMRGILINWLIEVHSKYDLMQETLFLMVELLDRVLSKVSIKKDDLQNLGLTSLLLASKYEDFWHPKIDELISISVNAFTREQMLAMEKVVLTHLKYRLNMPTPYVFMLRFLKASQSDKKLEHLAFYLIELCLSEYEALQFKPSLLCASAIYTARHTLHMIPAWTALLRKHARYEESELRDCAELILRFQRASRLKPTSITYDKFQRADRSCVAAIEPLAKLPH